MVFLKYSTPIEHAKKKREKKGKSIIYIFWNKMLPIFFRTVIQTATRIDFRHWEVNKLEIMHFLSHAFSDWGTYQGPKLFLNTV